MENEIKTVVFLSNFFNHHQKPFSDAMYKMLGNGYKFVETSNITDERKNMGWGIETYPSYVISQDQLQSNRAEVENLILNSDAVIIGSAPDKLIKKRLKNKKVVFRYLERIYKIEPKWYSMPLRFVKYLFKHTIHKNLYLLCASAYTAGDFARTKNFIGKTYKWGYFPECINYKNVDELIESKKTNSILWCGRFIDWKHPEYAIELAKNLKKKGCDFELNMIGAGEMVDEIKTMIEKNDLADKVHLLGPMKPESVRKYMEQSEIFVFTSDRQEGWGAVLNEAMNSACAVVANNSIGSAPYLIKDGTNGLLCYNDSNTDELIEKVEFLLNSPTKRKSIGKKACETIVTEWNAAIAAKRFVELCQELQKHKKCKFYIDGPCSISK